MATLSATPVTAIAAGSCGLLMSYLSFKVGDTRYKTKVYYGDMKNTTPAATEFTCAVRAHQNMTEYVPIFLIILAGLESNKVISGPLLQAYAAAFVTARTAHSLHLGAPNAYPRMFRVGGYLAQIALTVLGGGALAYWGVKTLRA